MMCWDSTSCKVKEPPLPQRDIFGSVPQGGDSQRKTAQPVVEVFAEPSLLHLLGQVPVSGRNDARFGLDGPGAADPAKLTLLENPQQFCLGFQGKFADFVQKEGGLVCQLEMAEKRRNRSSLSRNDSSTRESCSSRRCLSSR